MKRIVLTSVAAVILAAVSGPVAAIDFGDPEAGKQKATACAACHGEGGGNNPSFPKIAGQHADYLLHALKAYKSGERENAIMQGQVANLSQQDMEDLAAYFASLDSGLHAVQPD